MTEEEKIIEKYFKAIKQFRVKYFAAEDAENESFFLNLEVFHAEEVYERSTELFAKLNGKIRAFKDF